VAFVMRKYPVVNAENEKSFMDNPHGLTNDWTRQKESHESDDPLTDSWLKDA